MDPAEETQLADLLSKARIWSPRCARRYKGSELEGNAEWEVVGLLVRGATPRK